MNWQEINNTLVKTFTFRDFDEAWAFMSKVALVAKQMDHHPTWTNEYNTVKFELSTHSAGQVTDKDRQLASAIDALIDTK
jgi:4a-hydroxytetrahydrobiopterin dehydratase